MIKLHCSALLRLLSGAAVLSTATPLVAADPPKLSPAAEARFKQELEALQARKRARTAAQGKIASSLLDARREQLAGKLDTAVPELRREIKLDGSGAVQVDISGTVTPALLAEIKRLGGTVEASYPAEKSVRARLPLSAVESLAAHRDVRFIRPPVGATTNVGSVNSEGDVAHRANTARTAFSVNGTGVKIGVLSDSVDFLAQSQANGNLGPVTVLTGQAGTPGSGEGTAMLEIVHDIAPGSELFFATAFNGIASFATNIRNLAAAGCTVIVDDVTYFNESPFQDGPISQAVNDVSAQGVLFFSSARNSGNKNDNQSGTWEGDFADGGGGVHNFGGGVLANSVVAGGGSRRVDLFWADPLGASTNDYDLFVVNSSGTILRSSTGEQSGTQDPYESIGTLNVGEFIRIVKFSGANRFLHLDTGRARLAVSTEGNVRGHNAAGAANAFSVAAVSAQSRTTPFTTSNVVETFSSDGFRRIFFNPNGTAITPGNFSSSGGVLLQKPDIAAADGVVTSVPGFNPFFGTSAAAPHAAALAALIKSARPTLTAAQVRTALGTGALDIEAVGFDRDSGVGIIDVQAAIAGLASQNLTFFKPAGYNSAGDFVISKVTGDNIDGTGFASTDTIYIDFAPLNNGTAAVTNSWTAKIFVDNVERAAVPFTSGPGPNTFFNNVNDISVGSLSSGSHTIRVVVDALNTVTETNESIADNERSRTVTIGGGGNQPPIASAQNVSTLEDTPRAITLTGSDPEGAPLTFTIVTAPSNGTLSGSGANQTFTPGADFNGNASFTFRVNDGQLDSAPATVNIALQPVNDPPSFVTGPDQILGIDAGAQVIPGWASAISPGPADEAGQTITFAATADDPSLFSVLPAIASDGTLTFTPAAGATGSTNVTVTARDDGGTANGGVDASAPQSFGIALGEPIDPVGSYFGLIESDPSGPREHARSGLISVTISRRGRFTSRLTLGGTRFIARGAFASSPEGQANGATNGGAFALTNSEEPVNGRGPALALTFNLNAAGAIVGAITADGDPFSTLSAEKAVYTSKKRPKPPLINPPRELLGRYTFLFPPLSPAEQGRPADEFPQGDGCASGSVSKKGAARFRGRLADGTRFSFGNRLTKSNVFPLHILTDKKRGSVTGRVAFRDRLGTDFDVTGLVWFKPDTSGSRKGSKTYPNGWASGIFVDGTGSKFERDRRAPILTSLPPPDVDGNARITFTDGGLAAGGVTIAVNIDDRNRIQVVNGTLDKLKLKVSTKTGLVSGEFVHPATGKKTSLRGVVAQKTQSADGFFVSAEQSGGFELVADAP